MKLEAGYFNENILFLAVVWIFLRESFDACVYSFAERGGGNLALWNCAPRIIISLINCKYTLDWVTCFINISSFHACARIVLCAGSIILTSYLCKEMVYLTPPLSYIPPFLFITPRDDRNADVPKNPFYNCKITAVIPRPPNRFPLNRHKNIERNIFPVYTSSLSIIISCSVYTRGAPIIRARARARAR